MKIIRLIYTGYILVIFSILFFIAFPFLLIPVLIPKAHALIGIINRIWARLTFALAGIPVTVEYEQPLDPGQQYIFCPNHFSYSDIPAMGLLNINTVFVGKSDMESIPLFGFMYRKLHITVNRSNLKSRGESLRRSLEAIDEGKSLIVFPEGGIITTGEPVMSRFKDGAFRVAMEKQIPIVPVTIPWNWVILPPEEFLVTWHPLKLIVHKPLDPESYESTGMDGLKRMVYETITETLESELNYENRSRITQ